MAAAETQLHRRRRPRLRGCIEVFSTDIVSKFLKRKLRQSVREESSRLDLSNIELTSQSNRIDIHGSRQRYDFCASSVKYEQLLPLLIVESELGGSTDHFWSTCPYWCQLCFTIRHVEGVCHYIPVGEDLKRCSGSHTERLKSGRQQDAYKKGKSDCELAI